MITCYKLILFRFLTYPWAKKETLYLLFCSLIDFARHVLNKYEMLLFTISSQPYNKINVNFKRKKQSFAYVLQNRCSRKFWNIHRKKPVLESLFNKVAGLKFRWCLVFSTQVFSCEYCDIFKNTFFIEQSIGEQHLFFFSTRSLVLTYGPGDSCGKLIST